MAAGYLTSYQLHIRLLHIYKSVSTTSKMAFSASFSHCWGVSPCSGRRPRGTGLEAAYRIHNIPCHGCHVGAPRRQCRGRVRSPRYRLPTVPCLLLFWTGDKSSRGAGKECQRTALLPLQGNNFGRTKWAPPPDGGWSGVIPSMSCCWDRFVYGA